MSKAFTRESDGPEEEAPLSPRPLLPPGVPNYITPGGAQRLREELARLSAQKQELAITGAATASASSSGGGRLRSRIRQLEQILNSVVITESPASNREIVRFGAHVTVRHQNGDEAAYQIVGADEAEPERGQISWRSPLARQLFNHRAGETIHFRSPAGEESLLILTVKYDS